MGVHGEDFYRYLVNARLEHVQVLEPYPARAARPAMPRIGARLVRVGIGVKFRGADIEIPILATHCRTASWKIFRRAVRDSIQKTGKYYADAVVAEKGRFRPYANLRAVG